MTAAPLTFQSGLVLGSDRLLLTAALEATAERSYGTRVFEYDGRREQPWKHRDLPWRETVLARYNEGPGGPQTVCLLSDEGQIELITGDSTIEEDITDAGLMKSTAKHYGYVSSARQVGSHLYASGVGGQVYRRTAPGKWEHMDEGLLQPGDGSSRLMLYAIDGSSENDLYVAGDIHTGVGIPGRLYHWDGKSWRQIIIPPVYGLNAIFVESEQRIWLAGLRGALLLGNQKEGFVSLLPRRGPHLFHDIVCYKEVMYLASNQGLYRYDPERRTIIRVRTGLPREPSYVSHIDQSDDVLWCFGPSDILRFDGETWTAIQLPENPPAG